MRFGAKSKFITIFLLTGAVSCTASHSSSDLITHSPCTENGVLCPWVLLFLVSTIGDEPTFSDKIHSHCN